MSSLAHIADLLERIAVALEAGNDVARVHAATPEQMAEMLENQRHGLAISERDIALKERDEMRHHGGGEGLVS